MIHQLLNYEIIKLTSKPTDKGDWTYEELERFMDLPADPMQIEIRQYREAIKWLKFALITGTLLKIYR